LSDEIAETLKELSGFKVMKHVIKMSKLTNEIGVLDQIIKHLENIKISKEAELFNLQAPYIKRGLEAQEEDLKKEEG